MAEQKESRLNEFLENPERSLWSIAIPVIAGMAIQTFYSIVDMLFIGQLGGSSIAAVAFNMPLYFFVMGITFGIGTGITATIARAIGEEDKEKADNSAKHGLLIALFMGVTLTFFGLLTCKKVLSMLGSPEELIDESWSYLRVTCYGMMFIVFSIVFRSILAGEGDMKFPVMVAATGTILNIILDPIFIFDLDEYGGFGLDMGVKGAAAASGVSQMIVFFIFKTFNLVCGIFFLSPLKYKEPKAYFPVGVFLSPSSLFLENPFLPTQHLNLNSSKISVCLSFTVIIILLINDFKPNFNYL